MPETDQLPLFTIDELKLTAFLTSWCALEEAEDTLREQKRLLREDYADHLPLRGVLTAVQVVRAKRKLEGHPKAPMPRAHQTALEAKVEAYLDVLAAADELVAVGQGRFMVSIQTGEAQGGQD